MKTILAPTDFSENSFNAAEYAANMAKVINARIILYHVSDIPISDKVVASPIITRDELETKFSKTLQVFKEKLHNTVSPELEIEYLYKIGNPAEDIKKYAKETDADMIVMGIRGMNKLDEMLIGSVASETIKRAICPVLVVPSAARFNGIHTIAFACDTKNISGSRGLALLKEISQIFNAKIHVVNVHDEFDGSQQQNSNVKLPAVFVHDIDYSISFQESDDVVKGIHNFAESIHAELVAMIPRQHSTLSRIFNSSTTKEVAFKTKIPLLTLPEN